jgi:hypothetical protein
MRDGKLDNTCRMQATKTADMKLLGLADVLPKT